ncbi:Rieske (2Fe-2S) protein [Alkalihalobacillus sp. BA299]|uniref:Rieske (2Fe-2S) protein n=1 Tax=Alkalihalobacillus sp. BA299 TaxID=2815938 RepID=UPI001FFE1517|nr:Rieske (2Fe-2S) protein [Alkalihalobacillus sp. BA299]
MKKVVCHVRDIEPGEIKETKLEKKSIIVCRTLDGEFYAFLNRCIHQGAPLSKGMLCGTSAETDRLGDYQYVKEGEVLRCPWHGREFDVKNKGCMLAHSKFKLKNYKVEVENEEVVIYK